MCHNKPTQTTACVSAAYSITSTQLLLCDITMNIEQQSYYDVNEPWTHSNSF